MNRIITRIWGPLVVLTETCLLVDIATDLYKKYQDWKAKKNTNASPSEKPAEEAYWPREMTY